MFSKPALATAIALLFVSSYSLAQTPSQPARPNSPGTSSTEDAVKRIDEQRKLFEKQQQATSKLLDQATGVLKNEHRTFEQAEKAVDELIAHVDETIRKTDEGGELNKAVDTMIADAISGRNVAEGYKDEELKTYFTKLEAQFREAKQSLAKGRVEALKVLQQLKARKGIIALAAKAQALGRAYGALNEAIKQFNMMVEQGNKFLNELPKPPGS